MVMRTRFHTLRARVAVLTALSFAIARSHPSSRRRYRRRFKRPPRHRRAQSAARQRRQIGRWWMAAGPAGT